LRSLSLHHSRQRGVLETIVAGAPFLP